jgi:hypothetical protein
VRIVARVGSRGNVYTESLPSNGYTHHDILDREYKNLIVVLIGLLILYDFNNLWLI